MKVLIVSEPGCDGVFRHVEGLIGFLIGRGVTVHFAYSSKRSCADLTRLAQTVSDSGGHTLDLHIGPQPHWIDATALMRLWRFSRQVQPDVMHGHSSKAGVLVRLLRKLGAGAPCVYTPHAYYGLAGNRNLKYRLYNRIETIFGHVGRTINISEDESKFAKAILRIPSESLDTIHNPVDTSRFNPCAPEVRKALLSQRGIPDDAIVLGTVGRLCFQKDPETLYRAFACVASKRQNLWLCHLGSGELEPEIRQLALELGVQDRILRIPRLEDPSEFYHLLDGVILTSRYEAGWPLVMLEALACDLPVIVSKAPGTLNVASAGLSHAWTGAVEDVSGFAHAIEEWMEDLPKKRLSNHRRFAISRFSLERCYGAVLVVYQRMLQRRENRRHTESISSLPRSAESGTPVSPRTIRT